MSSFIFILLQQCVTMCVCFNDRCLRVPLCHSAQYKNFLSKHHDWMEPPSQQRGPRGFGGQLHATDGTKKAICFCFVCLFVSLLFYTKEVTPNPPRPLCFTSVYWMFEQRNDLDSADASWSRGHIHAFCSVSTVGIRPKTDGINYIYRHNREWTPLP